MWDAMVKSGSRFATVWFVLVLIAGCSDSQQTNPVFTTDESQSAIVAPDDAICVDPNSENSSWSDNCVLAENGRYANSLYTLGVQRILWCLGYGRDSQGLSLPVDQFVTGLFDTATNRAVSAYQSDNSYSATGIVSESTWGMLQEELVLLGANATEYSSYSIRPGRCTTTEYFYQRNSIPYDWKLAIIPGSQEQLDFSIALPTLDDV